MAIHDSLKAAKAKLEETMRDRRFRRANLTREEKVALQTAQAMCRGQLEVCLRDFERIVREQSRYIREGETIGADTLIQEQMLWDAAIGYMLVRDAIYSLRTINNHNSVSHAYDLMDLATRHMSGKKSGLPLKTVKDRNIYGFVTSNAAYKAKSELLDSFFEELKVSGKIEDCLNNAQHPAQREAALRNAYTSDNLPQRDPISSGENEEGSAMSRLHALNPEAKAEINYTHKKTNPRATGIDFDDEN